LPKKISFIEGVDAKVDANERHILAERVIFPDIKINPVKIANPGGMGHMSKQLLWPWEVAREVGVSAATVRRMADAGVVAVIRDARGRRHFRPEVVDILKTKLGLIDATSAAPEVVE
jgi:hypothetical protein